jgi:hypothetical protein
MPAAPAKGPAGAISGIQPAPGHPPATLAGSMASRQLTALTFLADLLPSPNIAAPRAAHFQEMTASTADQGHALVQWTAQAVTQIKGISPRPWSKGSGRAPKR